MQNNNSRQPDIVDVVSKKVTQVLAYESLIVLDDENGSRTETTSAGSSSTNDAVSSLIDQLTSHVLVELTKAMIARSERLKPEEASGATEAVVKKMCVEVTHKISHSLNKPSSEELDSKLNDVKILLQDTEMLLKAKKVQQAQACLQQMRMLLG